MGKEKLTAKQKVRYVPYVKGFRRPSRKRSVAAVGTHVDENSVFYADPKFFHSVPRCTTEDDWLAQYNEHGQTFSEFLHQCPWLNSPRFAKRKMSDKHASKCVYILPLGKFNDCSWPCLDTLVEFAEIFLGCHVKALPALELRCINKQLYSAVSNDVGKALPGAFRIRCRHHVQSGHHQLSVGDILRQLPSLKPPDALCVIALTVHDLYSARSDLFVAGMAAGNKGVATFSLFRYDPDLHFSSENWHEVIRSKKSCPDRQCILLERSCRLVVHEVAHLLGIDHCIYFACCMNGSGHLTEDFMQPMYLCPVDLRKLHTLCGFDVVKRYETLLQFYNQHGLVEQAEWTLQRIRSIKQQQRYASGS